MSRRCRKSSQNRIIICADGSCNDRQPYLRLRVARKPIAARSTASQLGKCVIYNTISLKHSDLFSVFDGILTFKTQFSRGTERRHDNAPTLFGTTIPVMLTRYYNSLYFNTVCLTFFAHIRKL